MALKNQYLIDLLARVEKRNQGEPEFIQTVTEVPIIPEDKNMSLFDKKIRSFLDACKGIAPVPVPSSQIIYNQAIIDGIAKSAECGREVEIVIPEI